MPDRIKRTADEILGTGELALRGSPEVADEVYALFNHAVEQMAPYHRHADMCRKYYYGEQLVVERVGDVPSYENEVLAVIDTMVPRIVDAIADVAVIPANEADQADVEALNQRVQLAMRLSRMRAQREQITYDVLLDGGSVVCGYSKVKAKRRDSREVLPLDDEWESGIGIVEASLYTRSQVERKWGLKARGLEPAHDVIPGQESEPRGAPTMNTDTGLTGLTLTQSEGGVTPIRISASGGDALPASVKKVLVLRLWFRDGRMQQNTETKERGLVHPHGRVIDVAVAAGSDGAPMTGEDGNLTLLADIDNPFIRLFEATERFPVVCIRGNLKKGRWGLSSVTPLIPQQDALNAHWKKLYQNMKYVVKRRMITSHQSGINTGTMTDEEDQIIHLAPGAGKPSDAVYYPEFSSIIPDILAAMQATRESMREISGIPRVSRGMTEPGITAGRAIDSLAAQADPRIYIKARRISEGMELVVEMLAYTAQDFDEGAISIPDMSGKERKYVAYDPANTRKSAFFLTGTRMMTDGELAQIIGMTAELQKVGVSPELLLRYKDDPRLVELWLELKEEAAKALKAQADREDGLKRELFAQQAALEAARSAGQPKTNKEAA